MTVPRHFNPTPEREKKIDLMAVDQFVPLMHSRLAEQRGNGRHSWHNDHIVAERDLLRALKDNLERGRMLDVAILAMFLHYRRSSSDLDQIVNFIY